MNRATYYIGANNNTHVCEVEKAIAELELHFEGFTVLPAKGYWQGASEDSIRVECYTEKVKAECLGIGRILAENLDQNAVAVAFEPIGVEFVTPSTTVELEKEIA